MLRLTKLISADIFVKLSPVLLLFEYKFDKKDSVYFFYSEHCKKFSSETIC